LKKSCGCGKVSILKGLFNNIVIYKVVHKNSIGKILYEANISGVQSKIRKIEEKSFKN
jgi:hypothetical protein